MNFISPVAAFPNLMQTQVTVSHGECLPRWEAHGAVYDIALHLADSVPTEQLLAWREKREQVRRALADEGIGETARQALASDLREVYNARVERYLTAGHGECPLRRAEVAQAVAEVLEHDNGKLYALHVYTVMPNHLHVMANGFEGSGALKAVLDQWKRISAHLINRICGRQGDVWQRDAYTHIVRNREEYAAKLKYIWNNPEAARLSEGFLRKKFV